MSFSHTKAVWQFGAGKVTGSRLLLWLFLAECANDNGVCWPSKVSICEKTGLNERTVRSALTALEAVGAISVARRSGVNTTYLVIAPDESFNLASKDKEPTVKVQSLPNSSEGDCKNTVTPTVKMQGDNPLQKYSDCKNTPTVKVQCDPLQKYSDTHCKNAVSPTVKIQSEPIKNLSITYQEPRELDSIFSKTTSQGKPEVEEKVEPKDEVLPLDEPPVPQKPAKRSRKKAVTDCPFSFDDPITDEYRKIAKAKAPKLDAQAEFTSFVCYYHRSGKQCADWSAAWRNWLIKAVEFKASKPSAPMATRRPVADYSQVYDNFDDTNPPF